MEQKVTIYFFDTYAFMEIIKGNKSYEGFLNSDFRTTLLNLYELYYNLLKDYGEETAKKYFRNFFPFVIEIKNEYIFEASKFKLNHKKTNISYVDALGYSLSKIEDYKFLTGDKEFENMPNVEFVK